jgi:holo-[acyl-carrier protein] synthase
MVKGIGVDIIEISRVKDDIEASGDRFIEKIFTPREIAYCASKFDRHQHFAARFAAKEAVSKALSTGWAGEFRWKDVEIVNDASGQPHVILSGKLREILPASAILVSISHSKTHVVAVALIQGEGS